ncbi:Hypothetical predicted protein [Olea europaea subsp. europaea]|uniref:Uncharacterized protein n=1 Tax=Olea europaea subsp. europaea TaxID=158383 RepID=A0A8S0RWT6_OLEEU|nr:Hypothetical predicted protein [Olea europaea subsp. europaea]
MDGYFRLNMKRKELEDVNNEFSDFSLSSPARKTRRLDADLLPVIKEEESEIPMSFEQSVPEQSFVGNAEGLTIEELPTVPENQERSIVLFNPTNMPLLQSPSNFSISVNPDLISGLKNQVLWSSQSKNWRSENDEAVTEDKNSSASNNSLAVVPWVPSQHLSAPGVEVPPQADVIGKTGDEEVGDATMDIEVDNDMIPFEQRNVNESNGMSLSDGLHHWQQQPWMIPQPPQNTVTPVVWYR